MKLKLFTFCWCLFLMLPCVGWAQGEPYSPPYDSLFKRNVYTFVEEQPEYPDGTAALVKYISQNVTYAITAETGMPVGLDIAFIVEADGTINDVNGYVRYINQKILLEPQSLECLRRMPLWKPGKSNGKNVAVKFTLPIRLRLN